MTQKESVKLQTVFTRCKHEMLKYGKTAPPANAAHLTVDR
jgi:hypothetical protein